MRFSSARLKHVCSASDFRRPMLIAFCVRQCDLRCFSPPSNPPKQVLDLHLLFDSSSKNQFAAVIVSTNRSDTAAPLRIPSQASKMQDSRLEYLLNTTPWNGVALILLKC